MKILPINYSEAIQLNPNLGIILTTDMEGWFMERYINLFMIGTTIDYIDNVNYNGALLHRRRFSNKEIKNIGIINIIEQEINNNYYMHIWIDEMYLPHSIRYQHCHFVHPLMVYGYDSTKQIIKCVFFDILKGQVLIDVPYNDFIKATAHLEDFYNIGGSDCTLNETVLAYELSPHLNGGFHIGFFAQQLSDYLCCETDAGWEWYTSCRAGVYDSRERIFGIQIYNQLIYYLKSSILNKDIKYKTLHDFITHKKFLLNRLMYVQQKFPVPHQYSDLVTEFANVYNALERLRLLGMKTQLKKGLSPLIICREENYLERLISTLHESYIIEMRIIPQIYNLIINLDYSNNHYDHNHVIRLFKTKTDQNNFFHEYNVITYKEYIYRIDVIRQGKPNVNTSFDYLVINDHIQYYLRKDSITNFPVRTISMVPLRISSLRLYTSNTECDYTINLYPLPSQSFENAGKPIIMNNSWQGWHHIKHINHHKLEFKIVGEDPFMIHEKIGVNADEYNYLHIKMSTTAKTIYAQVFFSTIDNPHISMDKSLFFKIIPDGISHSYYINMSNNINWHGFVKAIRFDPAQYHDLYEWDNDEHNKCVIDKLEFLTSIPDDATECSTATNLKDDGSTFLK